MTIGAYDFAERAVASELLEAVNDDRWIEITSFAGLDTIEEEGSDDSGAEPSIVMTTPFALYAAPYPTVSSFDLPSSIIIDELAILDIEPFVPAAVRVTRKRQYTASVRRARDSWRRYRTFSARHHKQVLRHSDSIRTRRRIRFRDIG